MSKWSLTIDQILKLVGCTSNLDNQIYVIYVFYNFNSLEPNIEIVHCFLQEIRAAQSNRKNILSNTQQKNG